MKPDEVIKQINPASVRSFDELSQLQAPVAFERVITSVDRIVNLGQILCEAGESSSPFLLPKSDVEKCKEEIFKAIGHPYIKEPKTHGWISSFSLYDDLMEKVALPRGLIIYFAFKENPDTSGKEMIPITGKVIDVMPPERVTGEYSLCIIHSELKSNEGDFPAISWRNALFINDKVIRKQAETEARANSSLLASSMQELGFGKTTYPSLEFFEDLAYHRILRGLQCATRFNASIPQSSNIEREGKLKIKALNALLSKSSSLIENLHSYSSDPTTAQLLCEGITPYVRELGSVAEELLQKREEEIDPFILSEGVLHWYNHWRQREQLTTEEQPEAVSPSHLVSHWCFQNLLAISEVDDYQDFLRAVVRMDNEDRKLVSRSVRILWEEEFGSFRKL